MAVTGHLSWFVQNVIRKHIEETDESRMWDLYLYRVFDKSYDEFKKEIQKQAIESAKLEYVKKHPEQVVKTVEKSRRIMEMFNNHGN